MILLSTSSTGLFSSNNYCLLSPQHFYFALFISILLLFLSSLLFSSFLHLTSSRFFFSSLLHFSSLLLFSSSLLFLSSLLLSVLLAYQCLLCCAVLCCAVLCCAVLCCAALLYSVFISKTFNLILKARLCYASKTVNANSRTFRPKHLFLSFSFHSLSCSRSYSPLSSSSSTPPTSSPSSFFHLYLNAFYYLSVYLFPTRTILYPLHISTYLISSSFFFLLLLDTTAALITIN